MEDKKNESVQATTVDSVQSAAVDVKKTEVEQGVIVTDVTSDGPTYPLEKYTDHRFNLSQDCRDFIKELREYEAKHQFRQFQQRDLWKRKYHTVSDITTDVLRDTLDFQLPSGKYKNLPVSAILLSDPGYLRWFTERRIIHNIDTLLYRALDTLLHETYKCRINNAAIIREIAEHKKDFKRKYLNTFNGNTKYKKYKKY